MSYFWYYLFAYMQKPFTYFIEDEKFWLLKKYRPVSESHVATAPGNHYWYACLLSAAGKNYIKDECTILDYGCGNAPLANFLSTKVKKFTYFGLEPSGSPYLSQNNLNSQNINLGFLGTPLEKEALKKSQIAILGSVLTHLDWKASSKILSHLLPIVKLNKGIIVFSCFLSNRYHLIKPDHYPFVTDTETFGQAHITPDMIAKFTSSHSVLATLTKNHYEPSPGIVHRIVTLQNSHGSAMIHT